MMTALRIADLFCGAGGAARGYELAAHELGLEVDIVGVDIEPQKRYPYTFVQADALDFPLAGFDFAHASPPCQGYSSSKGLARTAIQSWQPLIAPMRERLEAAGLPWVIENVMGARREMAFPLRLCGTQFGLRVYRHRVFETSMPLFSPGRCRHPRFLADGYVCIFGGSARRRQVGNRGNCYQRVTSDEARAAMAVDWMTLQELSQAIPPAYTRWIGLQMLSAIAARSIAA